MPASSVSYKMGREGCGRGRKAKEARRSVAVLSHIYKATHVSVRNRSESGIHLSYWSAKLVTTAASATAPHQINFLDHAIYLVVVL